MVARPAAYARLVKITATNTTRRSISTNPLLLTLKPRVDLGSGRRPIGQPYAGRAVVSGSGRATLLGNHARGERVAATPARIETLNTHRKPLSLDNETQHPGTLPPRRHTVKQTLQYGRDDDAKQTAHPDDATPTTPTTQTHATHDDKTPPARPQERPGLDGSAGRKETPALTDYEPWGGS